MRPDDEEAGTCEPGIVISIPLASLQKLWQRRRKPRRQADEIDHAEFMARQEYAIADDLIAEAVCAPANYAVSVE